MDKLKFVNGMRFLCHPCYKNGVITTKYDLGLTIKKLRLATKVLLKGAK